VRTMRERHAETFELAEELNQYANWKLRSIAVKASSLQHLLVASMLPRLLTAFQAAVIVAERGMQAEPDACAPNALERGSCGATPFLQEAHPPS
jgi:hypothetical protein